MQLTVLLPFRVFLRVDSVLGVVAETRDGSIGLLPRRRDCVAALAPGVLVYRTRGSGDRYVAVDEGLLVKSGFEVRVAVRNAIGGTNLGELAAAIDRDFAHLDDREKSLRSVLARLESDFIHRLVELRT